MVNFLTSVQNLLNIPEDKVVDLNPIDKFELTEERLNEIRENLPKLVFKNSNRKFMQKK